MIQFLTDFGDQSVILPDIAITAVVLLVAGETATAILWLACTCGVLAVMVALKLGFTACAPQYGLAQLTSPSGHTASTTVVYTLLAAITFPKLRPPAILALGLAIALGIATTRVILHAHTIAETVMGATIGLAGVIAFTALRRRAVHGKTARRHILWPIPLACALGIAITHGNHLPAENQIRSFASTWLRVRLCP